MMLFDIGQMPSLVDETTKFHDKLANFYHSHSSPEALPSSSTHLHSATVQLRLVSSVVPDSKHHGNKSVRL
jgi:hypothetical protein